MIFKKIKFLILRRSVCENEDGCCVQKIIHLKHSELTN